MRGSVIAGIVLLFAWLAVCEAGRGEWKLAAGCMLLAGVNGLLFW